MSDKQRPREDPSLANLRLALNEALLIEDQTYEAMALAVEAQHATRARR